MRNLGLGRGRIGIQDPVDGLLRVVGVERAEDQVAGLGRAQAVVIVSASRISPTRMTFGS